MTFSDSDMTQWFSGLDQPERVGYYELRRKGSREVSYAFFQGRHWFLEFEGSRSPLSFPPHQFEWRGLLADPTPVKAKSASRGGGVFVWDARPRGR